MLGQVAALRSARCTMADLHRDVSERSQAELEALEPPRRIQAAGPSAVDVAIVGMACIYPDAPDLATFWSNVVLGKNSIREVSPDRWNPKLYFDQAGAGTKTPSKWGGFIPPTLFDPGAYGIPRS